MIKSIGIQRLFILLCLLLVSVISYIYGDVMLEPKNVATERALRSHKSEISRMTQNMENLRSSIEKFEVQKDKFENLKTLGFFDSQDRLVLRERLNNIKSESGLLSAQYTVNSAVVEKNDKAYEAGYKIFNTPINFSLSALNDKEIYKYVYLLNYGFPGQVTINELSIVKSVDVSPTLLRKIGSGDFVPVIQASLSINLRTLVEDPDAQINRSERQGE